MIQCKFDNDDNPKKRYFYSKTWDKNKPVLVALLLNPSVASENRTDPTSDFMIKVAKNYDNGSLIIVNVYPIIESKSNDIKDLQFDTTNYEHIKGAFESANEIVVGWGKKGKIGAAYLYDLIVKYQEKLSCFGQNKKDFSPTQPTFILRKLNQDKIKVSDVVLLKFDVEKTRKSMEYYLRRQKRL